MGIEGGEELKIQNSPLTLIFNSIKNGIGDTALQAGSYWQYLFAAALFHHGIPRSNLGGGFDSDGIWRRSMGTKLPGLHYRGNVKA
jgi:hypothetical protein